MDYLISLECALNSTKITSLQYRITASCCYYYQSTTTTTTTTILLHYYYYYYTTTTTTTTTTLLLLLLHYYHYTTTTLPLHYHYTTTTLPLHYHYTTLPLHYHYTTTTLPLPLPLLIVHCGHCARPHAPHQHVLFTWPGVASPAHPAHLCPACVSVHTDMPTVNTLYRPKLAIAMVDL